jgi:CDP-glycerol glycerophosphotransferase (TagB/SpsB family)
MDALQQCFLPQYDNILILKELKHNIQLYPLLGNMDFLLTDYSSVWVDYEILNKPIGFLIDDMQAYNQSRGFTFEDFERILPGNIILNINQLYDFFMAVDINTFQTAALFNKYKDNLSSKRLLKKIQL